MNLRKGSIVKLKKGQVGMVTYRRSNEEIGINYSHYFTITRTLKEDRNKLLQALKDGQFGIDDMYSIGEIECVIALDGLAYTPNTP